MSVRGDRTVYRERDSSFEESRSVNRPAYRKITRYQVPDEVVRSLREDEDVKEKIVIKRTGGREHRHDDDDSYSLRESVRERDRSSVGREREDIDIRISERQSERTRDPPPAVRREVVYRTVERDDYERPRSEARFTDRETVRAPSPPDVGRTREYRFERERDFEVEREQDYDVQRYSKTTEYVQPPAAPQKIVFRSAPAPAPIIIEEARREPQRIVIKREEPQYEFIERREVEEVKEESQSLVKREPSPSPEPTVVPAPIPEQKPEEEYFYERRVVERRRRSDSYDRKTEIRPRDSASQYSSDDSYEYVRREKTYDERRGSSPRHKLHLAEGAIAGIGAAEIYRHHRKNRGEKATGQVGTVLGGAAVGALGAEAISRVRSMRSLRDRSRSRSRSYDRQSRRDNDRRRSRSRSKSRPRLQTLGGLAAVAAVGALAGYALKKSNNKETIVVEDRPHRSRSRRRRGSFDSYYSDDRPGDDKHRNPDHRNRRIAQAGLASAAAAGIWEKVRSRSRGPNARPRSKIREGVPIVAAGLGGAALAGLYEKNKANKEAKRDQIIASETGRGRRARSRSRARSTSRYSEGGRRGFEDDDSVAYGRDPIYPDDRRDPGYYDEQPRTYNRRRGSSGSSPDNRYQRDRSRASLGHQLAGAGAAAGAGGLAAHEFDRRNDRDRGDRRNDDYDYNYASPNHGYGSGNAGYGAAPGQGPSAAPYFPPPPTNDVGNGEQNPYPTYNPQTYPAQPEGPPQAAPYGHGAYGESAPNLGQPRGAADGRRGQDPENVSPPASSPSSPFIASDARPNVTPSSSFRPEPRDSTPLPLVAATAAAAAGTFTRNTQHHHSPPPPNNHASLYSSHHPAAFVDPRTDFFSSPSEDGLESRRPSATSHVPPPRSSSRVRFDLDSNVAFSPEESASASTACRSDRDDRSRGRADDDDRQDRDNNRRDDRYDKRYDDRYDDDRNDDRYTSRSNRRDDRDDDRRDNDRRDDRRGNRDNDDRDRDDDASTRSRRSKGKERARDYDQSNDNNDNDDHDNDNDDDTSHRKRRSKGKERARDPDDDNDDHSSRSALASTPRRSRSTRKNSSSASNPRDRSPGSDSDATIDLPARFDEHGDRKPGIDPLTEKINDLLAGRGGAGGLFKGLASGLFGEGGSADGDGGGSGRRRSSGRR